MGYSKDKRRQQTGGHCTILALALITLSAPSASSLTLLLGTGSHERVFIMSHSVQGPTLVCKVRARRQGPQCKGPAGKHWVV